MPTMELRDGSLSAYALACGYVDQRTKRLENGNSATFQLSHNGSTYDIDVFTDGGYRGRVQLIENGPVIIQGWAQFDRLADARRCLHSIMGMGSLASVYLRLYNIMAGESC